MLPLFLRYTIRSVSAECPDTSSLLTQNNDGEQEAGVGVWGGGEVGGGAVLDKREKERPVTLRDSGEEPSLFLPLPPLVRFFVSKLCPIRSSRKSCAGG